MLYLPSLSVLAVDFAPWSLVAWMVKPTHGFALMSRICPLIVPVWAAARGADANASAATRIAVGTTDLLKIFMLHSPFRRGSWSRTSEPFRPIIALVPAGFQACLPWAGVPASCAVFPVGLAPRRNHSPVRNRIGGACFSKRPQAQQATVASAASHLFVLVARPRQIQWCAKLQAAPDDFAFLQRDDRRDHFYLRLWPRSYAYQILENFVVFRSAIRIARAVFRHRSNVNRARADRFRPTHRHGKKMRVAKWHVRYRNRAAMRAGRAQLVFRYGNLFVCQRGPTNRAEMVELHHQPFAHAVEIRDVFESPPLAPLRSLPVACMKQGDVSRAMALTRNRRADAGVHSPAQQHHRFSHVTHLFVFLFASLRSYLFTSSFLNSLRRRIPNKLVQL